MKKEKAGFILLIIVGLMLLFSAFFKLTSNPEAVLMFTSLNLSSYLIIIGIIEVFVALLLIIPKTQKLGTYVAFGYLGGAMVAHLTLNDLAGLISPIILFLVVLIGLFLKDTKNFL